MERNFIEKRMQRMNENREIDNLSVWSDKTICVSNPIILDNDLLTIPEYDIHDMYKVGKSIVALSSKDVTIKYKNNPTKRYKFDYILGTSPEDCLSATNSLDTIVQICTGDSLVRIIKIDSDDGSVDISYKSIPGSILGLVNYNPTTYKFIIFLHNAFYIGFKSTSTASGNQAPIAYTTDFITYTKVSSTCTAGQIQYFYQIQTRQTKTEYVRMTDTEGTYYFSAITCDNDSYGIMISREYIDTSPEVLILNDMLYPIDAIRGTDCADVPEASGYFIYLTGKKLMATTSPTSVREICPDITTLIGDIENNNIYIFYAYRGDQGNENDFDDIISLAKNESNSSIFYIYVIRQVQETESGSPYVYKKNSLRLKGTDFKFLQNFYMSTNTYHNYTTDNQANNINDNFDINMALYSASAKEVVYLHLFWDTIKDMYDISKWVIGHGGLLDEDQINNFMDVTFIIKRSSYDSIRYLNTYTGEGTVNKTTGYSTMTISKPSGASNCTEWSIVFINAANGDHCILFPSSGWGFSMYGNKYARVLFTTKYGTMTVSASAITIKCKNGKASNNFDNQASAVMNAKNIEYSWQAET